MSEKDMVDNQGNIALTEMRLQFETMAEMQKEERLAMQKMHNEEVDKLCEKHEKAISHWKHIVVGLIVALCILIGGIFGSIIYVLSNYEFVIGTYQDLYADNGGTATIEDGIHINDGVND